jgi:RNA polymerase subunit RPABC4/transcription elongation factor Spt4
MRYDHEMRTWPLAARLGMISIIPVFILAYSALVGFIYADAKRRRMRHVMWAWLALVPYFVGVILYFILRDPLPLPCSSCGMEVPQAFAFCPGCGASIHPTCSQCGKSLQKGWANCPYCGTRVTSS